MQAPTDSIAVRLLRWLANAVYRYPRLVFYPQLLLFVISIAYTVAQLRFDTSRSDLVGAEQRYHQNFQRFKKEFNSQDELVAVVESEDMEKNRQFVERLGARLAAETNLFTDVIFNNDVTMLGNKALLFFPEKALNELLQTLRDYRPFIQQFVQATNLNSLFRLVNHQFRTAKREQSLAGDGTHHRTSLGQPAATWHAFIARADGLVQRREGGGATNLCDVRRWANLHRHSPRQEH
jgi:hypothetical protein